MPDFRHAIDRRLSRLRLDPARRAEIVEELSQHLHDRYAELRSAGMTAAEAEQQSLTELTRLARHLAGIEPPAALEPPVFGAGGSTMLRTITHDIRYAVRTFLRNPGFTAVVLLTLGLGIGATTAIFSVLDGVMLRPLPYADIDRILTLSERTTDGRGMSVAWPNFQDWREQNQVFEHLGIYRGTTVNLTGSDRPERLNAAIASSDLFRTMGIGPLLGRAFSEAEDRPTSDRVVILSERIWRNRFNSDASLVGRTIVLSGQSHTVRRRHARHDALSLTVDGCVAAARPNRLELSSARRTPGTGRDRKAEARVSRLAQANADMDTIAQRLAQQYPTSNKNSRVALLPYYEQVVQNIRPALLVLISAVAFVLLIGCANLANLMLSRAESRHREVAIRAALGAARARLVQQLMVESVMLSLAGGAIGALFAFWAVKAFVASQPSTVPRIDLIAVDARVLAFTAAISIVTGILFGLAPALRATAPDLIVGLKEAVRSSATPGSRRIRSALIVIEVALAMVLLVGAGLTLRSFIRLTAIDPGFNPDRVVTARLSLPEAKYPDRGSWTTFHRELIRRVGSLPGVDSVGLNSAVPLEGGGSEAPVIAEGDPMPSAEHPATATLFQTSSPGYFRAMGIQLIKGREFTDRDTADTPPVVIVDETLVQKIFHGADPIGKRLAFELRGHGGETGQQPMWREVVGVVQHVKHYGLATEPPFVQLYTPYEQLPMYYESRRPTMALVVRTAMEPEALAGSLRREIAAIDSDIPLYGLQTMDRYLSQNTEQQRLSVVLLTGFSGLALVLAVVGIYGVLSYTVSQRTQEIGIRLTLGATRRDVLALVVGDGMRLAVVGIVIGLVASYGATQLLTALLYEVSPHDPVTFAGLAALLGVVAFVASALPGLRATRVSPIEALRRD